MAIEIRSNVDFESIKREILESTEIKLGRALEETAREIVTRTQKGLDANGSTFKSYSEAYRKAKEFATGRGSKPDLIGFNRKRRDGKPSRSKAAQRPGSMLASITSDVQRVGRYIVGRIFFSSVKEAQKARGNQRTRRFFALSRQQVERLVNLLKGQ